MNSRLEETRPEPGSGRGRSGHGPQVVVACGALESPARRRLLTPDADFPPIPLPARGDWLATQETEKDPSLITHDFLRREVSHS